MVSAARSEIAGNGVDDGSCMLQSFANFVDIHVERVLLALVAEIAQRIELIEVRADVEVVESGQRVFARL